MKYIVSWKDGKKEELKDLDAAMEFKMNNIAKSSEFTIAEKVKEQRAIKGPDVEAFRKTLTPLQFQEVSAGEREICYSDELESFYLKRIHKEKQFFSGSVSETMRDDEINKMIKSRLLEELGEIWFVYFEHICSRDEFLEKAKSIAFIKK